MQIVQYAAICSAQFLDTFPSTSCSVLQCVGKKEEVQFRSDFLLLQCQLLLKSPPAVAPPAKVGLLSPAAAIKVRTSSSNDIIKGPRLLFSFESTYNLPFCCSDRQSHPQSCCNHKSLLFSTAKRCS